MLMLQMKQERAAEATTLAGERPQQAMFHSQQRFHIIGIGQ
jgi:hypothetical protein